MSRSYRRPFAAITGTASAKDDKTLANRGVRRKQDLVLKTCTDYEDLLVPHRLECDWNNTYAWRRDSAQLDYSYLRGSGDVRDRRFYRRLLRK